MLHRVFSAIAVVVQCAAFASNPACYDLERAASGEPDVERLLDRAAERVGNACVGTVFGKLAEAASLQGRVADVERYAERSVKFLDKEYPPDHPLLLRPLAFLSAACFESKNIAKSRRAYDRLRRIPAANPDDRALVHEIAAMLFRADRNFGEAVREMRAAIVDRESAGRASGADQASFYHQLGALYVEQGRYAEAREAVARAAAIAAAAPDATPLDRVRLLETAAVIEARQSEWGEAERKFAQALDIVAASPALDPSAARGLLSDYAFVLRKLGRSRDARAVEKRLAALPPDPARAIVDITQLNR